MENIVILQFKEINNLHNAQQKYDNYFVDKMLFISN